MREEAAQQPNYGLILEKREKAMITGVTEVESFDDGQIVLSTHGGRLILSGAGLHVSSLLLEEGKLSLEGTIDGLHYEGNGGKRRGSLLRRFFPHGRLPLPVVPAPHPMRQTLAAEPFHPWQNH